MKRIATFTAMILVCVAFPRLIRSQSRKEVGHLSGSPDPRTHSASPARARVSLYPLHFPASMAAMA